MAKGMVPTDLVLSKQDVQLSLLKPEHFSALEKLAMDKEIWQYNLSFNDPALFKTHWLHKTNPYNLIKNCEYRFVFF